MTETSNPYELFASVFAEAEAAGHPETNAVCLATADAEGRPSARMVLLKGTDSRGFTFYTNLNSRKARELRENPHAALCFFWPLIGRQVRVEGAVEAVSDAEADAYFVTRPRGSQIGAWASLQSSELATREQLIDRVAEVELQYRDAVVPRPPHWSGYRLLPRRIEFWTAGDFRLHDRLVYETEDGLTWRTHRLYP
jgi:pyridoxamine 5'-phosphate oxidase